jgi:hypothetical protein
MKQNPKDLSLSLGNFNIPIFHSVKRLYAIIYRTGNTLSKRDKLGIHRHIEETCLNLFDEIIHAALVAKPRKALHLETIRMILEKLKHLIRLEYEMKIIPEKSYIQSQKELVEMSKMATGWLKYIMQNPPQT